MLSVQSPGGGHSLYLDYSGTLQPTWPFQQSISSLVKPVISSCYCKVLQCKRELSTSISVEISTPLIYP